MPDKRWMVIVSPPTHPAMNMALDSVMWDRARQDTSLAILRFYSWMPPGVSLGANQKPEDLVDADFCRKEGIPVVARVTGGSAIFHDKEITYSFSSANSPDLFPGPASSYEKICGALSEGLRILGAGVEWRGVSLGREPSLTTKDCFSLSTRHDLIINGRKLIGSAQRKDKTSFLQHGSFLLDIRRRMWMSIFLAPPAFDKFASLSEFISLPPAEKIIECLIKGFEGYFKADFEPGDFTESEIKQAEASSYRALLI